MQTHLQSHSKHSSAVAACPCTATQLLRTQLDGQALCGLPCMPREGPGAAQDGEPVRKERGSRKAARGAAKGAAAGGGAAFVTASALLQQAGPAGSDGVDGRATAGARQGAAAP